MYVCTEYGCGCGLWAAVGETVRAWRDVCGVRSKMVQDARRKVWMYAKAKGSMGPGLGRNETIFQVSGRKECAS